MPNPLSLSLSAAATLWIASCALDSPPTEPPQPTAASADAHSTTGFDAERSLSPLGREAFKRLLGARRFTDAAIYSGGVTPNEVIALRALWNEPECRLAFEHLLANATLPGQLFALCGLYDSDRERFATAIEPYRGRTELLAYQTGCLGFHDYPLADLVEIDRPGAVRLAPGEDVYTWLQRHDNPRGSKGGYWLDILGGGVPNVFREAGGFGQVRDETFSAERD